MKSMRKLKLVVLLLGWGLSWVLMKDRVLASEGVANLEPESGYQGECYLASVFMDGSYKILVTCRNLPVALGAENNRLVLWREVIEEGVSGFAQIGELRRGKLSATVNDRFEKILITAETTSRNKEPGGPILAQGVMQPIDFIQDESEQPRFLNVTVSEPESASMGEEQESVNLVDSGTEQQVDAVKPATTSKLASIFKGIAKAIGLGFVLLLVVVGVLGFLARKRGL